VLVKLLITKTFRPPPRRCSGGLSTLKLFSKTGPLPWGRVTDLPSRSVLDTLRQVMRTVCV